MSEEQITDKTDNPQAQEEKTPEQATQEGVNPTQDNPPPEQQGEDEKEKEDNPDKKEDEEDKKDLDKKLKTIGFDLHTLEEEYFNNNGALTEETLKALNEVGFTNEFIDSFIEGRKALYEQDLNELATVVGGRENYDSIIEWSAKNLDANVINSVNQVKDKNILKLILPTLQNKMIEKEGSLPTTTLQGTAKVSTNDVFESKAQMYEAIRDARYLTDEAYQEKVTRKIRASREAGIDLGI